MLMAGKVRAAATRPGETGNSHSAPTTGASPRWSFGNSNRETCGTIVRFEPGPAPPGSRVRQLPGPAVVIGGVDVGEDQRRVEGHGSQTVAMPLDHLKDSLPLFRDGQQLFQQ